MCITSLRTFLVHAHWRNWTIVKLSTDSGLVGYGEGTLEGRARSVETAITELGRYLVGKDPFAIERHFQEMYRRAFWTGGAVLNSAISAVEMALWDIKGKAMDVPVYELLGGKIRDRLKSYVSAWYRGDKSPEDMATRAKEVVARGMKGLKMNPFSRRPGYDFYRLENKILHVGIDCVAAVREAVGPEIDLYIDCNGVFNTVGNAIRVGKELEPYNISFIEEPIPHENLSEMAYFRRKVDIPTATGERLFTAFTFQQLLEVQGADVLQPDLCHCGGILEARKIAALADTHYVAVAPHNPNGAIGNAATVQLAACIPNFLALEQFPPEPWRHRVVSDDLIIEDGWMQIPDRPGLGVDFHEEAAAEHPYEPVDLYDLHREKFDLPVPKFEDDQE